MNARLLTSLATITATAALLCACAPPETAPPEPTPLFATDEEAFAAAEATYRAYVDALNAVDLSDPETFEDVYAWTTGEMNSTERRSMTQLHAASLTLEGQARVLGVWMQDPQVGAPPLSIIACYDVSEVDLRDAIGNSMVSADRPDVQKFEVTLVESATTSTSLQISKMSPTETGRAC
ncbi:hypothetical protein [Microbacterium hominis]|uniref:Lipoprotein n=1 Tax=Microbacterium hominis TaxID=162426 RepID=A0A7D4UID8_9MICO|nr:hypothetical protein [Microbacterium hominis]QKJ19628.1 hypothetical protein HQM25_09810 [Microbacterium hominis]